MARLADAAYLPRRRACGPDLRSFSAPDGSITIIDCCRSAAERCAGGDKLGGEQKWRQLILLSMAPVTNTCPTRFRSAQSRRMTQEQQEALGWWVATAVVGGAFVAGLLGGLGALL
jgi:hypothetical protein